VLPDDTHKQHIAVTQTLGCNPDAQHPTTHSNRSTSPKHIRMQAEPIAHYCGSRAAQTHRPSDHTPRSRQALAARKCTQAQHARTRALCSKIVQVFVIHVVTGPRLKTAAPGCWQILHVP